MEKVKRAYAKPTILKVELNHEQAVLSACQAKAKFINDQMGLNCATGVMTASCRKGNSAWPSWDNQSLS